MPISFPQFIKIRDFDLYEKDSLETEVEELSSKYKNHSLWETQDSQNSQTQPFSSKIHLDNQSQLSFQKWFMNEHLQTFDFQVRIYLETIFINGPVCPFSFLDEDFFGIKSQSKIGLCQIWSYLRQKSCILGAQESQIFMEKLQSRQKLKEFLQQICYKSSDQIAFELLALGNYVLGEYQKIKNQELSYQKLLNFIKKLVEQNWQTIIIKNNLQFLSFKKNNHKITISTSQKNTAERNFLEFLITTLFLVTFEYVNNPYYHEVIQTQLKRHIFYNNTLQTCDYDTFSSSDDESESQFFSHSKKKRK